MARIMTTLPASSWPSIDTEEIRIAAATDAVTAGGRARRFAEIMGFTRPQQFEIATAVSEAATNIAKFAGEGRIVLRRFAGGLEFSAEDRGPGIADPASALRDGFSEGRQLGPDDGLHGRRGLGSGLPAIVRLMDYLSIANREPHGLMLRAVKYLSNNSGK